MKQEQISGLLASIVANSDRLLNAMVNEPDASLSHHPRILKGALKKRRKSPSGISTTEIAMFSYGVKKVRRDPNKPVPSVTITLPSVTEMVTFAVGKTN